MRAVEVNIKLEELNITDNQFGDENPELIKQMC